MTRDVRVSSNRATTVRVSGSNRCEYEGLLPPMDRRSFFTTTGAAAVTVPLLRSAEAPARATHLDGLIDTNVYLSHWVSRHTSVETPGILLGKLRRHGIVSAWTGSFDGVLHTDIAAANARLAETCARDGGGVLRPFGTVNPTLPDWEDDVRRCHEVHRMAGLRLFPNYHGYTLDDARFARLIDLATRRGLLVQIALSIEDDRSQNPVLAVPPVQAAPLTYVMQRFPQARVMLLNSGARLLASHNPLLRQLTAVAVRFEIAMLETVAGIETLLKRVPNLRLAFGSYAPCFYFESALLKLQESALTGEQLAAIRFGHARAATT